MSKGNIATLGNLAIFLIVLLLILHITGYVEVRAKTTEGFGSEPKGLVMGLSIATAGIIGLGYVLSFFNRNN